MAYDFAVDSGKLQTLASALEAHAANIETHINDIYDALDKLESSWNDESYATFWNECINFKPSLNTLVLVLRAYARILKSETGEANYNELETAVNAAFAAVG